MKIRARTNLLPVGRRSSVCMWSLVELSSFEEDVVLEIVSIF